jgi:putative FmdB family regulatory protein
VPLYEYQCACCGRFELLQKFSDPPLAACPTCGGEVNKLLSAPAIQFKGTGWYITDYARKSGGDGAGKKGEATASASSGDSGSPDKAASVPKDGAAASGSTTK